MSKSAELFHLIMNTYLKSGGRIEVSYDHNNECILYDLNVGLKSHIHLVCIDKNIVAKTRYDNKSTIKSLSDLLEIYSYWFEDSKNRGWGKMYIPLHWKALFQLAELPCPQDGHERKNYV